MNIDHQIVKVEAGRVFAPSDFLEPGAEIVIACSHLRNLMVFTIDTWNIMKLRLADVPNDNTQMKMYQRLLLGYSESSFVDQDHSFLVPGQSLQFAAFKSAACWIPTKNYIELWSLENLRLGRLVDWLLVEPSGMAIVSRLSE